MNLNLRQIDEHVAEVRARQGDDGNVDRFDAAIRRQTEEGFAERDPVLFLLGVGSHRHLGLVFDNIGPLREAGMYEETLLQALTAGSYTHAHWPRWALTWMLRCADPAKLRAAGAPLPESGPLTLYRGVSGRGWRRKPWGPHWTANVGIAAHFARSYGPLFGDPAVYTITVPASAVLAYVTDRNEDDYVVLLPRGVRPTRLRELPACGVADCHSGMCGTTTSTAAPVAVHAQ